MFRTSWSLRVFLAGLLALGPRAHAALYTDASKLPKSTYDFVIVGGTLQYVMELTSYLTSFYSWHSGECYRSTTHRKLYLLCPGHRGRTYVSLINKTVSKSVV